MRRAQGALEFVMITVVMLLFFMTAFIIAERNFADIQDTRFENQIYAQMDRVQNEISVAYQAGPGYERDFFISQTLAGIPYAIRLHLNESVNSKDELILTVYGEEYLRFMQIPVNGTLSNGWNRVRGGTPVEITTLP